MNGTARLANARALRWRAALVLEAIQTLKDGGNIDEEHRAILFELSAVLDQYAAHRARGGIIPISRGLLNDQAIATWKSAKLTFEREAEDPSRLSRISRALRTLAQSSDQTSMSAVPIEVEEFCVRLLGPTEQ